MLKMIKKILILICVFLLLLFSFSLYIGNYLYDYTLNPHASKNIGEKIKIDQSKKYENQKWLDGHSQSLKIKSYDGLSLHGYYIEHDSDVYIIMIHGFRGDGTTILSPIKKMNEWKYNLLIPDLRGHGKSEGDYIGMGWIDRLDILEWIDFIIQKDHQAKIILYGVSMGGATVMNVAGEKLPGQVKAVIEDCGFSSTKEVFLNQINEYGKWSQVILSMSELATFLRAGYRLEDASPLKQVQKSQVPILFIHGDQDEIVPFSMLDELYQNANCPKEKLVIHGANHTKSCSVDSKLYYSTIKRFILKYISY